MDREDPTSITPTPENDQTRHQATTAIVECSVASPDLPRHLPMSSKPVVKNYCLVWLIPVTINHVSTMALLDTGATCTMVG